jgi:hypothetical protein
MTWTGGVLFRVWGIYNDNWFINNLNGDTIFAGTLDDHHTLDVLIPEHHYPVTVFIGDVYSLPLELDDYGQMMVYALPGDGF